MNNSVILQGKDENGICLLLHPFSWERKKKPKTHNFKNEYAKKNENEDVNSLRTM